MILAIDFDDTIHDTRNVLSGYKMGQPVEGAQAALLELAGAGNQIIIHTIWADSDQKRRAIAGWLEHFQIPCHGITSTKPQADAYIDDKGIHFTTWAETLELLNGRQTTQ